MNQNLDNDLISRHALLQCAEKMTVYDEGGWSEDVHAVNVQKIQAMPAKKPKFKPLFKLRLPEKDGFDDEGMRLINAKALEAVINKAKGDAGFYAPIYDGMITAIHQSPTVEAEIVRHGRWIMIARGLLTSDPSRTTDVLYRCSECNLRATSKYPYCHCGAKMDGD